MSNPVLPGPGAGEIPLTYAPWSRRVLSALIDFFGLAIVAGYLHDRGATPAFVVVAVVAFVWGLSNALLAGLSGQSLGKRAAGIRLVDRENHRPIGGRRAILRVIAHLADQIPMAAGYIAPLFDIERRCFADMIMNTVVVMDKPVMGTGC